MPSSAAAASRTAASSSPAVRRLVLVPADSPRSPAGVRRFRLARRRLEGRVADDGGRLGTGRRSSD